MIRPICASVAAQRLLSSPFLDVSATRFMAFPNGSLMPTTFISHASCDDLLVEDLERWLHQAGFKDLFVDHSRIRGGDKWRDALRAAQRTCKIVMCVVSPGWLASEECYGEFLASWYSGKRIIPLFVGCDSVETPTQRHRLDRVRGEDQGFDLSPSLLDGRLDLAQLDSIGEPLVAGLRAGGALTEIGLDPLAFEIDRAIRPSPYPGLESFGDDDADAAVFFGRSADIGRCLQDLREIRASGARDPYALLGASGSGKSSLLKAGILPRLRRERGWIVLRCFRPGEDPLFSFAQAIARTLGDFGVSTAAGPIRDDLFATWKSSSQEPSDPEYINSLVQTLARYFARMRELSDRPLASILVALDQAEELLRLPGPSADILCDYLRASILGPSANSGSSTPGTTLILTLRTDSFSELQRSSRFSGLGFRCTDIRPVPIQRLADVIEEPAARYGIAIDRELIELLIQDAPNEDALPLLAFALERLWRDYGQNGRLPLSAYEDAGKLAGFIDTAAERALRGLRPGDTSVSSPSVPSDVEAAAARAFVPPLTQLTEGGVAVRRVASVGRFSESTLEMLKHFVDWRLLILRPVNHSHGSTIEVAHESIYRSWKRLLRWIEPERERLQALMDLQSSARTWEINDRKRAYIDHRGRRLHEAIDLMSHPDFSKEIRDKERDYLDAAKLENRRRQGIRLAYGIAGLFVVLVTAVGIDEVYRRRLMQDAAILEVRDGRPMDGAAFAIAGANTEDSLSSHLPSSSADRALWETGIPWKVLIESRAETSANQRALTRSGTRLLTVSEDGTGILRDTDTGETLANLGNSVADYRFSEDESRLVVRARNNSLSIWDAVTGKRLAESGPSALLKDGAVINPKSLRLATVSEDGTITLWSLRDEIKTVTLGPPKETVSIGMSQDVPRAVVRTRMRSAELWDIEA